MRPTQVRDIIEKAVDNPLGIQPIMIWGPPGGGKSSIPKQVTQAKAIGFVDLRGPLLDPTDLRGIPTVDGGFARWLAPSFLPTDAFCLTCMRVLPWGTKLCPKCSDPNDPKKGTNITKRGILFLDELPSAPPLTQAGMYQLTFDRAVGEYHLPDEWYVIAAGNRLQDRAVSYRMPSALANRFTHIEFEANIDDWTKWAINLAKPLVNPNVISFLNFRPELLAPDFNKESSEHAFPSPRSWEFASRLVHLGISIKVLPELLEGTVGKGATAEFLQFLKVQTELPDIKTIFGGSNFWPDKRSDLKYALVAALTTRAKTPTEYERMVQYSAHIDEEFSILLITMLTSKDMTAMARAPSFDKWAMDHSDVIITKKAI